MNLFSIIYDQIISKYSKFTVESFYLIIIEIFKNYKDYNCFITNKTFSENILNQNIKNKQEQSKVINLLKEIFEFLNNYNVHDKIKFLIILKSKIENVNLKTMYLPAEISQETKNNIVSFVKKDLNIEQITITEKPISYFNVNNIIIVISNNNYIRYNISDFLIKIIKKQLKYWDARKV